MKTMSFPATFNAMTVTGNTKDDVMNRIRGGSWNASFNWSSMKGTGMVLARDSHKDTGVVRLYQLQKFNKKSSQVQKRVTRGKDKGKMVSTMTIIRRPHWVGTYIDVPKKLIKTANQYSRGFSLTIGI